MASSCPFCLSDDGVPHDKASGAAPRAYVCRACGSRVPRFYVEEKRRYPPVFINAIGFRMHGKGVYFAALFHALRQMANHWPGFFTTAITETDLDVVNRNIDSVFRLGELPNATPNSFPRPTMIRTSNAPLPLRNATLLFHDTGGECFEKASLLVQHAHFVKRARTAMLLIRVPQLAHPPRDMHSLVNTMLIGMSDLGAQTKKQRLLVVYSCADELVPRMRGWNGLEEYLRSGALAALGDVRSYMARLRTLSETLEEFTLKELGAHEFLNATRASFRSVTFCMVSAIGHSPQGRRTSGRPVPRRVLDPLVWQMYWAAPWWKRLWPA